ncbi:hypothetical protein BC628DRAFT_777216 [Trametes gibbosa]|nr:hypothetical protein BC628DRAFT_777216 [Trametes gibbosa]
MFLSTSIIDSLLSVEDEFGHLYVPGLGNLRTYRHRTVIQSDSGPALHISNSSPIANNSPPSQLTRQCSILNHSATFRCIVQHRHVVHEEGNKMGFQIAQIIAVEAEAEVTGPLNKATRTCSSGRRQMDLNIPYVIGKCTKAHPQSLLQQHCRSRGIPYPGPPISWPACAAGSTEPRPHTDRTALPSFI